MKHELSAREARVVGCMLEKQLTTPEQYPMTLNGLTTACNQKTNREPVMELSESDVQQTLDLLLRKHIIRTLSGSRTMKYEHRFCNSELQKRCSYLTTRLPKPLRVRKKCFFNSRSRTC